MVGWKRRDAPVDVVAAAGESTRRRLLELARLLAGREHVLSAPVGRRRRCSDFRHAGRVLMPGETRHGGRLPIGRA